MNDQELDKLLDQWEAPETPPWLKTKVMQAVREEAAVQEQNTFAGWWNSLTVPRLVMTAATVVLLTVVSISLLDQPEDTATEMVALEDALESFASFSNQEVNSWGEDPFL